MPPSQLLSNPKVRYILVFDLETTCWKQSDASPEQQKADFLAQLGRCEVTEVGAVLAPVDFGGKTPLMRFSELVQPLVEPVVTDHSLTITPHITQEKMNKARRLDQVWKRLEDAIQATLDAQAQTLEMPMDSFGNVVYSSWGAFDRNQLKQEEKRHKQHGSPFRRTPFLGHLNLKDIAKEHFNPGPHKAGQGLKSVLKAAGMPFQGNPHEAYADAYNTWRIYRLMRAAGAV
jgi:inhibitor of KinA sporulation pathway (predicted exonuclease)